MSKHDHNATIKATPESKTARYANPRTAPMTKRERRLAGRIADYDTLKSKVGRKLPGSLQ